VGEEVVVVAGLKSWFDFRHIQPDRSKQLRQSRTRTIP